MVKPEHDILALFEKKECVTMLAPMVRYGRYDDGDGDGGDGRRPLRMLCRKYDTDVVFSQMIMAESVVKSAKAAQVGELGSDERRGMWWW